MGSATVPVASFGVAPNGMSEDVSGGTPNTAGGTPALPENIWTIGAPGADEKQFGNPKEDIESIAGLLVLSGGLAGLTYYLAKIGHTHWAILPGIFAGLFGLGFLIMVLSFFFDSKTK